MTNIKKIIGIFVLVLVFSITVIGCADNDPSNDNGEGSSDLDGIWISTTIVGPTLNKYLKIDASNGSFIQSMAVSKTATTWTEIVKGTYPKDAKSPVTSTITEVNAAIFNQPDKWIPWDDLDKSLREFLGSQTWTISISDNQFISDGVTFKKQ